GKPRQPRQFEPRVVVVVEVVDPDHLVTGRQQTVRHMGTDEAGTAGHQPARHRPTSVRSRCRRVRAEVGPAAGPSSRAMASQVDLSYSLWPGSRVAATTTNATTAN